METRSNLKGSGLTNAQREGINDLSLFVANLPKDRKQIFESEVLKMKDGMKTLILRLPEEKHKALKTLAASLSTNMTDLVILWIDEHTQVEEPGAKRGKK